MKTIQDFVAPAMKELVERQEKEFRALLDDAVPGWTFEDVRRRCMRITRANDPIEYIYLDGDPVLAIHPLETSHFQQPDGNYTIRITQNIQRLRTAERSHE